MSSTASHDGVHLIDSHCEFSPAPKSRYSIKSAVREASANETLDFYRREVAVLAADSEIFQQQLDKIKETIDHQYSLQLQLQESEETVMKLRNQMSKLQAALHEERDHVLRLYAENDRLKLREVDDRKRIEQLQRLAALSPVALRPLQGTVECTSMGNIYRRCSFMDYSDGRSKENAIKLKNDTVEQELENVHRTLFTLRKQFAEQSRASEDRIQSLLDDQERRIREEGERAKIYRLREAEHLEQLKRCQLMLQEAASEYLHLRLRHRLAEKTWIAEKEQFVGYISLGAGNSLNRLPKNSSLSQLKPSALPNFLKSEFSDDLVNGKLDGSRRREWELRKTIEDLELQFDQQHKLANQFREQLVHIEEENLQMRQECSQSNKMFTDKIKQLKERNQLYTRRYEELKLRRRLEMEGYQTDISLLKKKLADTEAKLRQVAKVAEAESDSLARSKDFWMVLKSTAGSERSKILAEELWNLKHLMLALNKDAF